MLKVYFTAATSFNGELHQQYKIAIDHINKHDVQILSGEQIVNEKLLSEDKKLSKREIFQRENKLIEEADCVVAEVTKPSLGVGAEISFALQKNKSVLALVLDPESMGKEDKLSPMIAGNPSENLFIEFYNQESLPFSIKNFLHHVKITKLRRGKLIVIEGSDGSGKKTQSELLVNFLKERKLPVKYMDFPQYYPSFHGKTVAKFLRGEFGELNEVSPYLASLAYSLDRASVKEQMESFLEKGGLIVANRYATSNIAHQGAKFEDEKEKDKFMRWIDELEYKVHKIPREDIVVYLYVPWQIGVELSKKRGEGKYLEGKEDIHEKDLKYRQEVEKMYLDLANKNKHWIKINCVENGVLLSINDVHNKVLEELKNNKIIF